MTDAESADAVSVAGDAARRLGVTFAVIDLAQTADGRWIVIECNDAQESGYAGVPPLAMWQTVIQLESHREEAGA